MLGLDAQAAQIRWDGQGGDGLWSTAANWVGDQVPVSTDDVLLDNSVLAGSYSVTLPSGNISVSVNTLVMTPTGTAIITLINPTSNTSPTAFAATGPGDAVVLNSRAVFRNSSGASSGTPVGVTTSNFFRINNGGRYIHNCDRGHTTTLVARLSSAPGTENGSFEFDVPVAGFTFSFSGRIFGNLEFSANSRGGPVAYASVGSLLSTVNGNLVVNTGASVSFDYTNDILIKGSWQQAAGSSVNLSNGTANTRFRIRGAFNAAGNLTESGTGTPELLLDGSSHQSLQVTGSITNSVILTLNNPAGATLLAPIILPFKLQLVNGILQTTPANLLTLTDNATCTGASPASFVDGPVKKNGDESFDFPVGEGLEFAPLSLSGGGQITDEWIARYRRGNPQTNIGSPYEAPPVNHISALEWWDLERASGSQARMLTLSVRGYSDATLTSSLLVVRWDGSQWMSEGRTASTGIAVGTVTSGWITAFEPPGQATHFTLGSDAPFPVNPLPLVWLSVAAEQLSDGRVGLTWMVSDPPDVPASFLIQRTCHGSGFETLDSLPVNRGQSVYRWISPGPQGGFCNYRIAVRSSHGSTVISPLMTVTATREGGLSIQTITNPISQVFRFGIRSGQQKTLIASVFDLHGLLRQEFRVKVERGENKVQLPAAGLSPGGYLICFSENGRRIFTARIIRL